MFLIKSSKNCISIPNDQIFLGILYNFTSILTWPRISMYLTMSARLFMLTLTWYIITTSITMMLIDLDTIIYLDTRSNNDRFNNVDSTLTHRHHLNLEISLLSTMSTRLIITISKQYRRSIDHNDIDRPWWNQYRYEVD